VAIQCATLPDNLSLLGGDNRLMLLSTAIASWVGVPILSAMLVRSRWRFTAVVFAFSAAALGIEKLAEWYFLDLTLTYNLGPDTIDSLFALVYGPLYAVIWTCSRASALFDNSGAAEHHFTILCIVWTIVFIGTSHLIAKSCRLRE